MIKGSNTSKNGNYIGGGGNEVKKKSKNREHPGKEILSSVI